MNAPPDPSWIAYQQQMDDQNVNTLVVLHRVYAAFLGLGSCCIFGYLLLFLGIMSAPGQSKPPPPEMITFMSALWGAFLIATVALAVMNLLCANWLRDRRNWVGVVIISALNCLTGILGIGLTVYTLIIVNRPTVRGTFR